MRIRSSAVERVEGPGDRLDLTEPMCARSLRPLAIELRLEMELRERLDCHAGAESAPNPSLGSEHADRAVALDADVACVEIVEDPDTGAPPLLGC